MSDFFSRLTDRTLGRAAVARPDIAPNAAGYGRIETSDPIAPPLELASVAPAVRHDQSVPREPSPHAGRPAATNSTHRGAVSSPTTREAGAFDDRAKMPAAAVRPTTTDVAHSTAMPAAPPPERVRARTREVISTGRPNLPQPAATRERHDTVAVRAGAELPAGVVEVAVPPVRPPAINVTIGRIEVRTTGSAGTRALQRPSESRPRPLRSLDAYLEERNRTTR